MKGLKVKILNFVFYKNCSFKKKQFFTFYKFLVNSIKKVDLLVKSKINFSLQGGFFTSTPILRHIKWKLWTSIKVSHRLGKHLSICFLILLFFLQFAQFNLKAPLYSKTLHHTQISISRAPPPFRSIYNQDRGNSSCLNVALEKCKILIFFFFIFVYYWGGYY